MKKNDWLINPFGTFSKVSRKILPKGTKVFKLVMAFTYKFDKNGTVCDHKARFAFPGNRLTQGSTTMKKT